MDFIEALNTRMQDVASACVGCGKCFEVCPMKGPIGLSEADPKDVLGGIIDLIRGGDGNEAAQRWAGACSSSALCRAACDYGVDPLFLVKMANYANVRRRDGDAVRKNGAASFRAVAKSLRMVSRLQVDQATLAQLQPPPKPATDERKPDVAFYTGCNVGKTPHIVLLCVEILQAMGLSCEILGGSSACCGINQFRTGDGETAGRAGLAALSQIEAKQATANLSWCPTCQIQFEDVILPAHRLMTGHDDPGMTPFFVFLERNLDKLRPLLKHDIRKRVAINERPGRPDILRAVERLLSEIKGIELVHLDVPRAGLMSSYLTVAPKFKEGLRTAEFEAAARAGVTTLATIFHGCHKELCKYENDVSFEIVNVVEIIGESIGIRVEDTYKKLALASSVDEALQHCAPLLAEHGLNPDEARDALIADLLGAKVLQGAVQEIA
jgi:heterodisulfide reductase subunit D